MYVLGVLVLLGVYLFTNRKTKKHDKKQKRKILILFLRILCKYCCLKKKVNICCTLGFHLST